MKRISDSLRMIFRVTELVVCDDTPNPVENCNNAVDDDGDGLVDLDDPDCRPSGEEFRFELSNCFFITGHLFCDAEQISPLPPTYERIQCSHDQGQPLDEICFLTRIDDGGSDAGMCTLNYPSPLDAAVCFVETDG
jgi:hypothetical protein